MPNGSYQGTHTATSGRPEQRRQVLAADPAAEHDAVGRPRRGRRPRAGAAPRDRGRARRRRSAGDDELGVGPAGGAHAAERLDGVADALALDEPADADDPAQAGRARLRARPGVEQRQVDAAGTTEIRRRSPPRRRSSKTSSVQVATTRSASRTEPASTSRRPAGLVSRSPWWRRFTTPSAWKVMTTGTPSGRAAASAALPLIQKWAWTTSGPGDRPLPVQVGGEGVHVGQQVVLRHGRGRAGHDVVDGHARAHADAAGQAHVVAAGVDDDVGAVPGHALGQGARRGRSGPPASTPPSTARGLACSETIATLMRGPPGVGGGGTPRVCRPPRRRARRARRPGRGGRHGAVLRAAQGAGGGLVAEQDVGAPARAASARRARPVRTARRRACRPRRRGGPVRCCRRRRRRPGAGRRPARPGSSRPPRSTAPGTATTAVRAVSPGPPVTTTRWPSSSRACTRRAHHAGPGRARGTEAPGWTTTYGCSPVSAARRAGRRGRAGRRVAAGSAKPAASASRSWRSASCRPCSGSRWRRSSSEPG
jgi:hypothetical protein